MGKQTFPRSYGMGNFPHVNKMLIFLESAAKIHRKLFLNLQAGKSKVTILQTIPLYYHQQGIFVACSRVMSNEMTTGKPATKS